MKKGVFIFFLFIFVQSFSVVSGQNNSFYYDLIGKSRSYIERNYENIVQMPDNSLVFPNYYLLGGLDCDDGGFVGVLVNYYSYDGADEVREIAMMMQGCRINKSKDNTIYEALSIFSDLYGFPNSKDLKEEDFTVGVRNDDMIMMSIKMNNPVSGLAIYGVSKENLNNELVYTANIGIVR